MSYSTEDISRMEKILQVESGQDEDGLGIDPERDCLTLEDIMCFDADGHVTRQYDKVLIPKKSPEIDGDIIRGSLFELKEAYEKEGWMIPTLPVCGAIQFKLLNEGTWNDLIEGWIPGTNPEYYHLLKDKDFPFHPDNIEVTSTMVNWNAEQVQHVTKDTSIKQSFFKGSIDHEKMHANLTGQKFDRMKALCSFYGKMNSFVDYPALEGAVVDPVGIRTNATNINISTNHNPGLKYRAPLFKVIYE